MSYENYWKRPISRRRALAGSGAIGAGVAGFALVGCGDDDDDDGDPTSAPTGAGSPTGEASPTGSTGGPVPGGELVLTVGTPQASSLDPHTSVSAFMMYWPQISNRLVAADRQTLEPLQGELIESWEQVSDTEMILNVRPGVAWHEGHRTDGRAFTAEDVAFNLQRIKGDLDPDRSALFQRAATLLGQDTVEAVDEMTVRVTFSQPNSLYLHGVGDWRNHILASETVEADPNFTDPLNWSGTGPFTMADWDNTTGAGQYAKNPNYWKGEGRPYIDSIIQRSLPDLAAQQSAFISGDTDFLTAAQFKSVRDQVADLDHSRIVAWDGLFWQYLGFNQQRGAFENPDVRRAIFLALNYSDLMTAVFGEGFWTPSGPLPSALPGAWTPDEVLELPGYNPDTKAEDIAEALRLLDAAGYPNGEGIEFGIMPSGPQGDSFEIATFAQGELQAAFSDISVNIALPPTGEFSRLLSNAEYDMVAYVASSGPSAFLDPALRYADGASRNYTNYQNTEIQGLVAAGFAEFDADARNEIAGELQQLILDAALNVNVGIQKQVNAVNNRVKGFEDFVGPGSTIYPYDCLFSADFTWIEEDA